MFYACHAVSLLCVQKRALALCERAYAADPLHTGAKRRLSGWAPEKWKETIAKEVSSWKAQSLLARLVGSVHSNMHSFLLTRLQGFGPGESSCPRFLMVKKR